MTETEIKLAISEAYKNRDIEVSGGGTGQWYAGYISALNTVLGVE